MRRVFSRTEVVAILLRHLLPPQCLEYLELDSIAPAPTGLVNSRFRSRYSDLMFTVRLRGTHDHLSIYIGLDHQSTSDRLMPWRELEYLVGIWDGHLEKHPRAKTLPFLVPILLLQRRAWSTPTQLSTILEVPAELRAALGNPIELQLLADDLSAPVLGAPDDDQKTLALVRVARALLLAHDNPSAQTEEHMASIRSSLQVLVDHECSDDLEAIRIYTSSVFGARSRILAAVDEIIDRSKPMDAEYILMEPWITKGLEKGLEKGRAEGIVEGRARSLLDVLELRALPLSSVARDRILSTKDEQTLERWFRRALAAASLEDVFAPGEPAAPSMGVTP